MEIAEAIRIAENALAGKDMPLSDIIRINEAMAVLGKEYLRIHHPSLTTC